ncbi:hypothetical protein ACO2J1_17795 [Leptospira interrogans]|uniref:Lipoprotein n=2 Tax=Leptospira interrogans TaxID=173 RepID=A0AA41BK16_LEPIR|nr:MULTISPECIES: hypothetical protein [Leptospira]KAA1291119.1 hypothetical protein C4X99_12685 [Leptospira interrogans serovar Geyaweera]EKO71525.1 putative lipoprotein [Leptospira interrogans serovar Canicola str. Fiocruz LV133]EMJ35503.1 putative lipoprotein [Leptospira interrogans str. FPW1039]EMJ59646.1 putative lipoprotein [Leptospira interrogans serovar Pomona str. CSL4002]EMK20359.1 putative lipoprotein [Leptospira interrogans str. Kito]
MKTKYRFKLHSILGIVSILLLSCKNFFPIFNFSNSLFFQDLSLILGKIGVFLGLIAFLTGCGLGKYRFVQNSKYTEVHILLLLGGLILQVPSLSENHSNFYANIAAWLGYPCILMGWIYGRKIRKKK